MCDTKALLDSVRGLRAAGEPFLVATVVQVRGSSYRRPGARMLVTRDRWIAGSVSGGCLEGDVLKKGWWRTESGAPAIVTYDARALDGDGWGFGLGCDGVVDVLLERAEAAARVDPLVFISSCVHGQAPGALATVIGGGGERVPVGARIALHGGGEVESDVADGEAQGQIAHLCRVALVAGKTCVTTCSVGDLAIDVLVEVVCPPPRLFLLGAGHDGVPLLHFARALGWETIVSEPYARFVTRERFAGADAILTRDDAEVAAMIDASDRAAAVAMAHHYERDRASLRMLLGTRARYIGMLGPRRRTARMLDELGLGGDPRVHAPVGLALGAESPQEIALEIVAEVQAVLTGASAASLREQTGAIHSAVARVDAAE